MHRSHMDDLVSIAQWFVERDPAGAACLAKALGSARPRYGKVSVTFQNGNIICAGKEETFKPMPPLTATVK